MSARRIEFSRYQYVAFGLIAGSAAEIGARVSAPHSAFAWPCAHFGSSFFHTYYFDGVIATRNALCNLKSYWKVWYKYLYTARVAHWLLDVLLFFICLFIILLIYLLSFLLILITLFFTVLFSKLQAEPFEFYEKWGLYC